MALFVHLAPLEAVKRIRRSGIKAAKWRTGVYAMPVLPDFYASHQWLRELRIGHGRQPVCAVYFRVPGAMPVTYGSFNGPHVRATADEAAGALMAANDRMGFEVIFEAAIAPSHITSIKELRQVTGWRYFPRAKGRTPCACPSCLRRGEPYSQRIRRRFPD